MFWMYLNQKRFLNYMYLKLNNNNFTLSNQFDCSYYIHVWFLSQRKLNGETLEKITRELQVLNTF